MKLTIGYFYKDQLNLYGDNGNVEILLYRARKRGIASEVVSIGIDTKPDHMNGLNFIFMGGGPDSEQKTVYKDLLEDKGPFVRDFIENGGVGLFICGSYQLLGHYYEASDGSRLQGLGIFDLYTKHFGPKKARCIGNTLGSLNDRLLNDPFFVNNNFIGDTIVGFENHGGRTYLKDRDISMASVTKGSGNNAEDGTEGIHYKNSLGTYFHGPFLARNPHVADYLLAKALSIDRLEKIDDDLIIKAHTASKKLAQ